MKKEVIKPHVQQLSPERGDKNAVAGVLPGWNSATFTKDDWKKLSPDQKEAQLRYLTENTSPNIIYRYLGAVIYGGGRIENANFAQGNLFKCAISAIRHLNTSDAVVRYTRLLSTFALADKSFAGGREGRSGQIISSLNGNQIGALQESEEEMLKDLIKSAGFEDSLRRELVRKTSCQGSESMEAVERFLGGKNWDEYLTRMRAEAGNPYHDGQRDLEKNVLALLKHCPEDALGTSVELLLTISGNSEDAKFRRGEILISLNPSQIEALSRETLNKLAVNCDFPESRAVNSEEKKTLDAIIGRIEIQKICEKFIRAGSNLEKFNPVILKEVEVDHLQRIVPLAHSLLPRMNSEAQEEMFRVSQKPGVKEYLTVGCPGAEHSFLSNRQQSRIDDLLGKMATSQQVAVSDIREWADAVSKAAYFQTKSESYLQEMTLEGRTSALAQVITRGFEHERYRDNMTPVDWKSTMSFALGGNHSDRELPVIQHIAGLNKYERGMVAAHITSTMGTNAPPVAVVIAVEMARKDEKIYSLINDSPASDAASSIYELNAVEVAVAVGQNPLDSDPAVIEALVKHPNAEVGQIFVRQLGTSFSKRVRPNLDVGCEKIMLGLHIARFYSKTEPIYLTYE
jgi:hypothetical protein